MAALQRPSWPPLPGHDLAMQRIAARVSELYHDPESWTELDLRLKDVEWSMNDIGHWPLDVWCVFASAQDLCLVGNVNTASRVDDAGRIYGHRVTVVVSMLHPHEMKTRGAPSDWAQHFAQRSVRHIQRPLDDLVARTDEQRIQFAQKCISMWLLVCRDLWCHKLALGPGTFRCAVSLFRRPQQRTCHGLCMADCCLRLHYRRSRGVHPLGTGTWPWRRREYVLWAFQILEDARDDIVAYFQSKYAPCETVLRMSVSGAHS